MGDSLGVIPESCQQVKQSPNLQFDHICIKNIRKYISLMVLKTIGYVYLYEIYIFFNLTMSQLFYRAMPIVLVAVSLLDQIVWNIWLCMFTL